jgi:hypothetical protein
MEGTGNPTDRVYGVLFSIAMNEEKALDDAEGLDKGYRKDRFFTDLSTAAGS